MRAQTVTGEVEAGELGITLAHEHLNTDARFLCTDPAATDVPIEDVDPEDLRAKPMRFLRNLDMRDEPIAAAELHEFARCGGRTLVDCTPVKMNASRDPALLQRLSRRTGVNIVLGCGWYVEAAHPSGLSARSVEDMADEIVSEISNGVGSSGIRPGVIGEIGTGDPLRPGEARVLRAAAQAHLATGCPVSIHTAAGCGEVMRILDLLEAEGVADCGRIIIAHMDVVLDLPLQREVIDRGATVEYDTFGHESYPDSRGYMMPTDRQRVTALAELEADGLLGSVLLSHDVCQRRLWRHYGGFGYTNLLTRVPALARESGAGDVPFVELLVENPRRVFAFLP